MRDAKKESYLRFEWYFTPIDKRNTSLITRLFMNACMYSTRTLSGDYGHEKKKERGHEKKRKDS